MDQLKTGKFIAKMRKEKGFTQAELAEALLISDKTVSKWETGKGLPEVSLMLPLCEKLGISVNELLSGTKLSPTEYQRKAEVNIMGFNARTQGGSSVSSGYGNSRVVFNATCGNDARFSDGIPCVDDGLENSIDCDSRCHFYTGYSDMRYAGNAESGFRMSKLRTPFHE